MPLQLRFTGAYEPQLAGGGEQPKSEGFPVRLHVYGTHELRRNQPAVISFRPDAVNPTTHAPRRPDALAFESAIEWRGVDRLEALPAPLRAAGAYTFARVGRAFAPGKVSRAARLVFNAYAASRNTERQTCSVRVGSTFFLLGDLLRALRTGEVLASALVQNAINVDATHSAPDVVRTDEPLIKGVIELRRVWLEGGTLAELEQTLLEPQPAFDMATPEQQLASAREMSNVINRVMGTFFDPGAPLATPSLPPLRRFHAPTTLKDQLLLPSLGYVLNAAPQPPPLAFWLNLIGVVAARRGLGVEWLRDTAEQMLRPAPAPAPAPLPVRASALAVFSFLGALLTTFSNALPYLDDFANRNRAGSAWRDELIEGDEDNKIARAVGADDCEGLGLEIFMLAMDIYADVASGDAAGWATPAAALLRSLARLLRVYVPGLMFSAVTNARLVYSSAELTRETTLAHTFAALIPLDRFVALLSPAAAAAVTATARYAQLNTTECRALLARLAPPLLTLEGTAIVDALALPVDSAYPEPAEAAALGRAANVSAVRNSFASALHERIDTVRLQTEMLTTERLDASLLANRRDLSPFFKWVNAFSTSAFAESRMLDFAFYYGTAASPHKTYGVRFNDLVLAGAPGGGGGGGSRTPIGLWPTAVLTEREAAVIDNIMALDEAVPRLTLRDPAPAAIVGDAHMLRALEQLAAVGAAPTPDTPAHRSRMLVSGRVVDIGPDEVFALQHVAAMRSWARIEVTRRRIAEYELPNMAPVDVLDVVFHF